MTPNRRAGRANPSARDARGGRRKQSRGHRGLAATAPRPANGHVRVKSPSASRPKRAPSRRPWLRHRRGASPAGAGPGSARNRTDHGTTSICRPSCSGRCAARPKTAIFGELYRAFYLSVNIVAGVSFSRHRDLSDRAARRGIGDANRRQPAGRARTHAWRSPRSRSDRSRRCTSRPPRNYEVWYTYATGYNPSLNQEHQRDAGAATAR